MSRNLSLTLRSRPDPQQRCVAHETELGHRAWQVDEEEMAVRHKEKASRHQDEQCNDRPGIEFEGGKLRVRSISAR